MHFQRAIITLLVLVDKNMPSMVIASDDELDELNVFQVPNLYSPIPHDAFPFPASSPGARSSLTFGSPGQRKRGRSLDSDGEVVEVRDASNVKRARMEERKAVSTSRSVLTRRVAY